MGWSVPKEVINQEIYPAGTVQTKETFVYDSYNKITQKTSSTSRQSDITKYYYTYSNSIHSKNRIALDKAEQWFGSQLSSTLLSTSKVEYSNSWTDYNGDNVSYLPSEMKASKGSGSLEVRSKINRYDKYGHVLESEKPGGIKTSFVWGYNNTQIIAEIVNSAYSDIPQTLITNAQAASNSGNEQSLITALDNLRNAPELAQALLTTYTYKPLIGISSMKDARGYKITYEYDSNNRQKAIKDQDGNIVTESIYHTKPQN
jgi:YD repeat-containing protein